MEEYQALFEQAPIALAKLDANAHIQHANYRFAELLGRQTGALIARPIDEFIDCQSPGELAKQIRAITSGEQRSWSGKCLILCAHCASYAVEISATALTRKASASNTATRDQAEMDDARSGVVLAITNTYESKEKSAAWQRVFEGLIDEIHERHHEVLQREQILQILEAAPDCVAMIDAAGHTLYINPALRHMLGDKAEEHGYSLFTAHPPWAAAQIRDQALPTAASQGIWSGNSEIITADGKPIPVYQTVIAHREKTPDNPLYSTIIRDMSDLRVAETFQRQLLSSLAEGVFGIDLQGRYTFLNPAALRMLGFEDESEALGRNAHDLSHYNHPDGTPFPEQLCRIYMVQQTGQPLQAWEDRFWRPDGTSFPVVVYASPLYSANGQLEGTVVSFQDVSERIEEERRYRMAQEAASFGIWEWDLARDQIHWDDSCWQMLGYSPAHYTTLNYNKWRSLVHPEDLEKSEELINQRLAKGRRFSVELRYITADGDWLWVQGRGQAVELHADGTPKRLMGTHVDVSHLKETELALRRREQDLLEAKRIARLGNWLTDFRANFIYWSDEIYNIFGLNKEQWTNRHNTFFDIVHPDDRERVEQELQRALCGDGQFAVEHRIVRPDGGMRSVLERGQVEFDEQGEPLRMLGTVQDITEQRELEDHLRHLVTILDSTPDIVAMASPDGETLYLNASGKRYLTDHPNAPEEHSPHHELQRPQRNSLDSTTARDASLTAPLPSAYPSWAQELINEQALPTALREGYWQGETAICDRHNNVIPVSQVIIVHRNESDEISHISTILRDVTEQKRLEQALSHEATTDHLTGIFNRQRFDTELDQVIARHNRYGNNIGLIMFDIDHFKVLNDTYGHDIGDQVLIELTRRVATILRSPDILARWGGEEFVVILPETDTAGTEQLAERLRQDVAEQPFTQVGNISISLGATQIHDNDTPNTALKRVDNALYKAKRTGRNRVVFSPD